MPDPTTVYNPRTGLPRGAVPPGHPDHAAAEAGAAAPAWAEATPRQRAEALHALAHTVRTQAHRFIRAEVESTGRPLDHAHLEVAAAADVLDFYAGAARTATAPAAGTWIDGHTSVVRWEPLGVVAAILPWNYPLMIAAWRAAPALAAGNAVILKPAPETPDTAHLLAVAAAGHGVPLVCCPGGADTGAALVAHPLVAGVAFTGSLTAGTAVAVAAAGRPVSLELGGNSAALVTDDPPAGWAADLAAACVYNAGQSCAAPARVLLPASRAAAFTDLLIEEMTSRVAGLDFGPLISARQAARYDTLVRDATVTGKVDVADTETGYWRPASVTVVEPNNPAHRALVHAETFGPNLTVQTYPDGHYDTAIHLANGVPQALAGSVWTRSLDLAHRLAPRLRGGETWVNCHLVQTPELPHSGRGDSGTGVDLSTEAVGWCRRPHTITTRLGA